MTTPAGEKNPLARRWLLNLGLLVVVAALGVYAWYRSGEEPDASKPTLTTLDAASIKNIEISRPQQATVSLERSDDRWRLTAPIKARADSFAVEALLRLARAPIESPIAPIDGDMARYGLDQPRLTVRFDDTEIRFGEVHPIKDEYYAQRDNRIYLVQNRFYAQAAAPYTNLIDSRLIEPGRKLTRLALPDFSLTLKDGEWRREPEIAALSSDRINGFIDDWRHARALQVEQYSGGKAQQQIEVTAESADGHKETVKIAVLARKPELVLYRPDEGLEYHFPEDTAQRLLHLEEKAANEKSQAR